MLLKTIKTPGLSHLSYIIGSDGQAAVIDPRRDCECYVDFARSEGLEITQIFETHRNEDLISGSPILKELTGAEVWHGPNAAGDVAFARTIREGDTKTVGHLRIEALETPGHTYDHVAYAVYDENYPEKAVGVFSGDALFVGDVGRTDFYPDRAEEVAGLLFDSLQKIMGLGDQAILWPAHGAGSVCGSGMAEREFSTIGHERLNNPRLAITDRDEFIRVKTGEVHYYPPYFEMMERLNLEGGDPAPRIMHPRILSLEEFEQIDAVHYIDLRQPGAYAAGHFPGSYCIPVDMVPAFAGWFMAEGESIALIGSDASQLEQASEHLLRIGFDNIIGGYVGVVPAAAAGKEMAQIPMICTEEVERRLAAGDGNWTLIDVRAEDERQDVKIDQSRHIYAGHLAKEWESLDRSQRYTLMCASGMRASVAASWLASKGFEKVDIYLGSMGAWKAAHSC
jgi:hydroxyacylglutathione hydrolase